MLDIQKFCDALGEASRNTRKKYHLTLGALVKGLCAADPSLPVVFDVGGNPGEPHSYRGYYADLAFDDGQPINAGELAQIAHATIGQTLEGYKGGDFTMDADTPLWQATYGCGGRAITGMTVSDEYVVLQTKAVQR